MSLRSVTVYCASSAEVRPEYLRAARDTGTAVARAGWTLVYGGNRTGCMHEVASGARQAGGRVVGITPQLFVDHGHHDHEAHELVITPDMRTRKLLLEQRADAFIALPGGLGTYEELFEQLVARQLKTHDKPIVAVDVLGYFKPLREMIDHGIEHRFIKPKARHLLHFAETVDEAVAYLRNPHAVTAPLEALSHEAAGG